MDATTRKIVNAIETAQSIVTGVKGSLGRKLTVEERAHYARKLEEAAVTLEAARVALRTN